MPITAVGGFVYHLNARGSLEVLLIKKRGGFWTLPKGRVNPGESHLDALQREVYEETGITGDVETAIRQVAYDIFKRGRQRRKIVTYYLLHARDGELRPDPDEGIECVRWFPLRAAIRRIRRNRVRWIARHAESLLDERVKE
jgi:8-oxo-dGTP pyrophosphatase MutT (NUDIX family)